MLSLLESDRQDGIETYQQIPLIHIVDKDDRILLNSPDAEWFKILYYFPWEEYREIAAEYYDALYQFNIKEAEKRQKMLIEKEDKAAETKEEAVDRLLFSRATMQDSKVEKVPIIYKGKKDEYCYMHVPGLRKIEQFDQIMRETGLWSKIKLAEVRRNIEDKIIKREKELVGDTTHYYAYSSFDTVTYKDENGREQKKSQSKVTKNCRCKDRDTCSHQWELADEGAGTIVKSKHKMYWGHKASVLGLPRQGVPLDAVAAADAATFDGETLYPHVERLFENLPEIKPWIDRVLYDSACDNKDLKEKFQEDFGIELKASLNPRRKKDVTKDLPRGIEKITP